MVGFLKVFLQGVLYVVLSPLIVATLAVYGVYCVFVFIYIAIRSVIVFFMGGTPLGDLPEDVEAKRILMQRAETQADPTQTLANAIAQSQMQFAQNFYAQQNNQPAEPINEEPTTEDVSVDEEVKIEEYDDGLTD